MEARVSYPPADSRTTRGGNERYCADCRKRPVSDATVSWRLFRLLKWASASCSQTSRCSGVSTPERERMRELASSRGRRISIKRSPVRAAAVTAALDSCPVELVLEFDEEMAPASIRKRSGLRAAGAGDAAGEPASAAPNGKAKTAAASQARRMQRKRRFANRVVTAKGRGEKRVNRRRIGPSRAAPPQ